MVFVGGGGVRMVGAEEAVGATDPVVLLGAGGVGVWAGAPGGGGGDGSLSGGKAVVGSGVWENKNSNDEIRMTNQIRSSNDEVRNGIADR